MAHYYSKKQPSRLKLKKIEVNVGDMQIELFSGSGVFSKDRLDKGSQVLIENCLIQEGGDVLDLGAGIGVVGIAIKKMHPSVHVVMTEVNERAVKLALKNVKLHNMDIKVVQGDSYENIDGNFDTILLNPPQTAGKDVCFSMIDQAPNHLKEGGMLQLVARHKKGGASLEKKMKQVFGNVRQLAKQSGYRVYASLAGPVDDIPDN